jgi:hypothetical protein
MVPIALTLSAAVAAGTILFGRGAELQDPVARATATYMPEIRRAEAELKQAEANMRSPDMQVAQSKAEALEVKATTPEMQALELKVDRLRTDLIGTTRNPSAMSADLAVAMLELETAKNNAAEARIRLKVLDDLALTEEVQRARDKIELLNNKIQSIPQAAAAFVATEKLLEAASAPALLESRRHRENLLSEALAKNSDGARASARLGEIKARVVSQELTESRQRLEQERAAARSGR